MTPREAIHQIKQRMAESIIGQDHVVERLLIALLANGNVLMEGLPGLAKTRAIKSLSRLIESEFRRIQFTPDLLPADVTGSEIYFEEAGRGAFKFQPGPIFGNLILADEINRAPAKVQAALLEAMEERQVTVAGKTHKLPALFMVLATQNPVEQEGTYPLPEAQMDRFLLHVFIKHPSDENERKILRLVRSEEAVVTAEGRNDGAVKETGGTAPRTHAAQPAKPSAQTSPDPSSPLPQSAIFAARAEVHAVQTSDVIERYIVDLVSATRNPGRYGEDLKRWIHVGASPRGTLALDRACRAYAWLQGRDHVLPDDVQAVATDCLRHRLILSYEASAEGVSADDVVGEIVKQVAVG